MSKVTGKGYPLLNSKLAHFWHGGDYNPDQWQASPQVWDEDIRLMKLAGVNVATVGVFSWAQIEIEEGKFEFGWLDQIMDKLAENGIYAILATPSAAHPVWMARKYPEILRVTRHRQRSPWGYRTNYCLTSPIYRQKCRIIDAKLAERYKNHPALVLWHVSNEMAGQCHCQLCQQEFRKWLKEKYQTLDRLNHAWWTAFWSHSYSSWGQIESSGTINGTEDDSIHGLQLDWQRFMTDQHISFFVNERDVLRHISPEVPITTNTWRIFGNMDFRKFAPQMDVVAWDCYPPYHDQPSDWKLAPIFSFSHDCYRAMKGGKPFLLMEITPSSAFMFQSSKLKRPNIHRLTCLQAVAHGADGVCYFQWRQGRGGAEKFHGAVVAHSSHENTRVFKEVSEVGRILKKLDPVIGTSVQPEVAVIYDPEINWILDAIRGHHPKKLYYRATCVNHYRPFWEKSVSVDVIHMDANFSKYKLLVAPMLYLLRSGVAERIEEFVENGGTFVTTYLSGIVNENDLCFLGGFPGPLRKLLGIWAEELDAVDDETRLGSWVEPWVGDLELPQRKKGINTVIPVENNPLGLNGVYQTATFCDLIHTEGAEVLATYGGEFYAGRPAVTVNYFGKGKAFYIASRNDERFLRAFYSAVVSQLGIQAVLDSRLPEGVTAQVRTDGKREFIFLLNFKAAAQAVDLGGQLYTDLLSGQKVKGSVQLASYGSMVLERKRQSQAIYSQKFDRRIGSKINQDRG